MDVFKTLLSACQQSPLAALLVMGGSLIVSVVLPTFISFRFSPYIGAAALVGTLLCYVGILYLVLSSKDDVVH